MPPSPGRSPAWSSTCVQHRSDERFCGVVGSVHQRARSVRKRTRRASGKVWCLRAASLTLAQSQPFPTDANAEGPSERQCHAPPTSRDIFRGNALPVNECPQNALIDWVRCPDNKSRVLSAIDIPCCSELLVATKLSRRCKQRLSGVIHSRTGRRLSDRLGIVRIVLLSLHIGFDVLRGDQPYIGAELGKLPAPITRPCVGLQSDSAGLNLTEQTRNPASRKRRAEDLRSALGRSMCVKRVLDSYQAYNANLFQAPFPLEARCNKAIFAQRCREGAPTTSRGAQPEPSLLGLIRWHL